MKPVVIVNFKTYVSGDAAVRLARECEAAGKRFNVDIRVAVQAADIFRVSSAVKIPVYAQHVDAIMPGRNTGFLLPEAVVEADGVGTLLNHSEHRLSPSVLAACVERAKGAGLAVVLCGRTPLEGARLAAFKPEFVAVEPPELIGGTKSVSTAEPYVIQQSVERIKVPILVGAGVHTAKDVEIALKLGARGVLLASAIANVADPHKALEKLLKL